MNEVIYRTIIVLLLIAQFTAESIIIEWLFNDYVRIIFRLPPAQFINILAFLMIVNLIAVGYRLKEWLLLGSEE